MTVSLAPRGRLEDGKRSISIRSRHSVYKLLDTKGISPEPVGCFSRRERSAHISVISSVPYRLRRSLQNEQIKNTRPTQRRLATDSAKEIAKASEGKGSARNPSPKVHYEWLDAGGAAVLIGVSENSPKSNNQTFNAR
jgi:hypothetical protein